MPSRRSPAEKDKLFKLVFQDGYNLKQASKMFDPPLDPKTASAWIRGAKNASGIDIKNLRKTQNLSGPKERDELSKPALKALDDFGYFRRRYMGRIASPWQEDVPVLSRIVYVFVRRKGVMQY